MKKIFLLGLLALPAFAQTFVQAPSSLIVPAGSSIQGVAGTAAAIDYTIDCVEQYTTTPQIPKQCAQGQLSNSVGSIYAPTSLYNGFVTHITLTNDTGSTVPGITLYKGGTAAANTIYGTISIAAHNRCSWTSGADWSCTDATGALLTSGSSSGGGSVIGGTGINITGGTTVNITTPIPASIGGSGVLTATAHSILLGQGTSAFTFLGPCTSAQIIVAQGVSADPLCKSVSADLTLSATGAATLVSTANVNSIIQATRLDQFAAPNASVSWNSQKITNLLDPTSPQDAATKAYVDATVQGLAIKASVDSASTAPLPAIIYNNGSSGFGATLTGVSAGAITLDGASPLVGERVLIKDQVSALQNGIYTVTATGSGIAVFVLTRSTDMDAGTEVPGAFTFVEDGATQSGNGYVVNNPGPYTIGTTAINWTQFSGAGQITAGAGLTKIGNQLDVVANVDGSIVVNANDVQLGVLPTSTAAAGTLLFTNTAAPSTPASGKSQVYVDSTSKNVAVKNDAGVVNHGVQTQAVTSNSFLTSISDAGAVTVAQPAFSNVSGSVACGQLPPLTGAVTSSGCATTAAAIPTTALTGALQAAQEPAHTGGVTNTAGSLVLTVITNANLTGGVTSVGNAATVVTNANLTGPVTSSGNATTITPTITAAGPTGSSSVIPVITYNAAGQLTAVTTATVSPASIGAVSSVAQTVPTGFAVSGSPITSTGTLAISYATGQAQNLFLATPNGSTGALSERAIVAADVPTLNQNTSGSAGSLSATLGCAQFPALSGAITTSAGSCSTTASAIPTTALTGTLQAAQFPALTGDCTTTVGALATSCTKTGGVAFGTLATLNAAPAGTLTGSTLASGVTASSLTSVGTLGALTVTAPIAGSVTGTAAGLSATLGCAQFPALSGGVSNSAGSCSITVTTNANLTGPVTSTGNATAVTPGALTNTMLATMPANTVKANITAGVASPTDVTLSSFKTWLALVSTDISDFATAVRATVLTGLSTATNAVVSATDTVLQAIGKLQAQITANKLMYNAVGDFGMVGDQRVTFDGACSTGSNTKVTSATAAFVSGDNGHRITLAGGGASGATLVATISNIDSGTQVTVTGATCGTTVSAKGLQLGTDNTTACNLIVSTMNALTYPGAKIMFPPSSTNRWACPVSLPFTVGVDLVGQASAITQDFADYTKSGGTALVWWGTDNDAGVAFQGFVQFSAVVANNRPLSGAGLHDIWLDCRNGDQNPCATAARFVDVVGMDVRNVFVMDALSGFNTATADMGSVTSSSGRGTFSNIGARLLDNTNTPQAGVATAVTLTPTFVTAGSNAQVMTAAGSQSIAISAANGFATPGYFWFTAANGSVYFLKCTGGGSTTTLTGCAVSTDGASENPTLVGAASAATASSIVQASPNNGAAFFTEGTANTNSNLFTIDEARWSFGTNYGPAAIEMHNSDSNVVRQSVGNGGNVTNDGAVDRVRRPGVRFGGSSASATQASRNNSFYDGDPGVGGVVAMGVNNAGAILAGASGPNYWYRYQTGNGAAIPVVEAVTATATQAPVGAIFEWTGNGPLTQGQGPNHPSTLTPGNSLVSTAATDVVIPGCLVKNPPQWAQAGLSLQWRITMSKTAAGTPTHIYKIFYGASGAVGTDAAVLTSATGVAGTAAADAQEITLTMALPSVGASVTPLGSVMRTGKMNVVATGYGNLTATAPTMAAINTGTAQTFLYPAIRTSATGETNTVLSCRADVIQAAAQ